jgi:hypothetical protein
MTPQQMAANRDSWREVTESIDEFPDENSASWKSFARRFIGYGIERNFDRHFRAGTSMMTLVFSTLDHHGLNYEASVSVALTHADEAKVVYSPSIPATKGDERLQYILPYEDALPTLQRFLNHLWEVTKSEPLPSDMRSPDHPFLAPNLESAPPKNRAEQADAGKADPAAS